MSGPAGAAVDAYSKVNDWMSPLSGLLDELMRPVVEPLAEPLECVTGDPEGLQKAADLWAEQAGEIRALIADQRRDRKDLAHEWSGEAATAFLNELIDLEAEFEAEAADMDATAELLREAAEECRVVRAAPRHQHDQIDVSVGQRLRESRSLRALRRDGALQRRRLFGDFFKHQGQSGFSSLMWHAHLARGLATSRAGRPFQLNHESVLTLCLLAQNAFDSVTGRHKLL